MELQLLQIRKDDAVKVLQTCQQILKTQQWPQDRKRSVFTFQSQRKAMPKNAQATVQLHAFHIEHY